MHTKFQDDELIRSKVVRMGYTHTHTYAHPDQGDFRSLNLLFEIRKVGNKGLGIRNQIACIRSTAAHTRCFNSLITTLTKVWNNKTSLDIL
jgi:hypothetical protein